MQVGWFALIPPLVVIIIAILTKRLNIALLCGIVTTALIASEGVMSETISLIGKRLWQTVSEIDNIYLYSFLFTISSLIVLFGYTGCTNAFTYLTSCRLNNKKAVQTSSILISFMLSVDDYLSILTTGYIMRPLIDAYGIPRVKLAYLTHSLAGVVVILLPVSSWVATITGNLYMAGVDSNDPTAKIAIDPFFLYLQTIPFMFYSLLVIASVIFVVHRSISYGPMREYEKETVNHTARKDFSEKAGGSIFDFLAPLFVLVGTVFFGIPYAGGFWMLGGSHTFIQSLKNNNKTFLIMFIASALAFILALTIALLRRSITMSKLPRIGIEGINLMKNAVLMVFLASTLSIMIRQDVQTGQYLAHILYGAFLINLLPVLFFLLSFTCAISTGSAWGTFGLMIPIAIPMIVSLMDMTSPANPAFIPILYPILGAIFSGSVCGDHVSPFSETTIMAATSAGVTPLTHFYTQAPYAAPAFIATTVTFIVSGFLIAHSAFVNAGISLGIGLIICFGLLTILNKQN